MINLWSHFSARVPFSQQTNSINVLAQIMTAIHGNNLMDIPMGSIPILSLPMILHTEAYCRISEESTEISSYQDNHVCLFFGRFFASHLTLWQTEGFSCHSKQMAEHFDVSLQKLMKLAPIPSIFCISILQPISKNNQKFFCPNCSLHSWHLMRLKEMGRWTVTMLDKLQSLSNLVCGLRTVQAKY